MNRYRVSSVAFFMGFVWLHVFIRVNSYGDFGDIKDVGRYMIPVLFTLVGTAFYYWCMVGSIDDLEEEHDINCRKCTIAAGILWLLLLIAFVLEVNSGDFSLYENKEIVVLGARIPKRLIFDIYAIIVFPLYIELCLKAVKKRGITTISIAQVSFQIMSITFAGYLIFYAMNNVWLLDLMMINIFTVALAMNKYLRKSKSIKEKNIWGCVFLYALIWLIIILTRYGSEGIVHFLYGNAWENFVKNTGMLINNAELFGTSASLKEMLSIHTWLYNRNNYIQQLLYYGGWAAVIGLIGFMSAFLIVLFKMVKMRNYQGHRHPIIYMSALWMFIIRVVMGTLYSYAIVPIPENLPFSGTTGIITDSIVFMLLLNGECIDSDNENRWVPILMGIIGLLVCANIWLCTLQACTNSTEPIKYLVEEETSDGQSGDTVITSQSIVETEEGTILIDNNGDKLCGPYKMIYEDVCSDYSISRFESENGLIGYLSRETGDIIVEAKFKEASKMSDGAALVSEVGEDGFYFISSSGERINKGYFRNAYPFSESQGRAARVQLEDGTWAIINNKGEFLANNFLFVNKLPCVATKGSAVKKNGHAVLFKLPIGEKKEYVEIKEYEDYDSISEVWYDEFSVVKNKSGLYGVVCAKNGDIIVQDKYTSVEWKRISGSHADLDLTVFIGYMPDGECDIITWNPT